MNHHAQMLIAARRLVITRPTLRALVLIVCSAFALARGAYAAPFTVAIPGNSSAAEIVTWESETGLNGIQLGYRVNGSAQTQYTATAGTEIGNRRSILLSATEKMSHLWVMYNGASIDRVTFWTTASGWDRGGGKSTHPVMKTVKLPAGQRFWGFTGTAEGSIQTLAFSASGAAAAAMPSDASVVAMPSGAAPPAAPTDAPAAPAPAPVAPATAPVAVTAPAPGFSPPPAAAPASAAPLANVSSTPLGFQPAAAAPATPVASPDRGSEVGGGGRVPVVWPDAMAMVGPNQGDPFALKIPAGSVLSEIVVYADAAVNGVQLGYTDPSSTSIGHTEIAGSPTGERHAYAIPPGDPIRLFMVNAQGDVACMMFETGKVRQLFGRRDLCAAPGSWKPTQYKVAKFDAGQTLQGLTGTADTSIHSLGLIVDGGATLACDGCAPTLPGAAAAVVAAEAAPAEGGFHPGEAPIASMSSGDSAGGSASSAGSAPTASGVSGSSGQTPAADEQVAFGASGGEYDGVYRTRNFQLHPSGDGASAPVLWSTPRLVTVEQTDPANIVIHYHDQPLATTPLTNRGTPGAFQGDGEYAAFSAMFRKVGRGYTLDLKGPNEASSGAFELTKVSSNVLSRNRFSAEAHDLLESGEHAGFYDDNLYSFDGLLMSLTDRTKGRKVAVFASPGAQSWAWEPAINLSLPFGLRAVALMQSNFEENELILSNESDYEKKTSWNFGGGAGGDEKQGEPSFGAKYSRDTLDSKSTTKGTHTVSSVARIERFVYVADLPNMQLTDEFRDAVEQLAAGRTSAEQLVQDYGTHYANAITYGGLLTASKNATTQDLKSHMEEKFSASAKGSAEGATAEGGYSESTSKSSRQNSMFSKSEFHAWGGVGTTSAAFFNVDDKSVIPVRYDLRPLYELFSPVFFPSGSDWAKTAAYARARQQLKQAIAAHLATAPKFSTVDNSPHFYQANIKTLRCLSAGDDGGNSIDLYGKIYFNWTDDLTDSLGAFEVFNEADDKTLACGSSSSALQINKTVMMVARPTARAELEGDYGLFAVTPKDFYEDDNSVDDLDDRIEEVPSHGVSRRIFDFVGKTVKDTFGSGDAPKLELEYTITEVK